MKVTFVFDAQFCGRAEQVKYLPNETTDEQIKAMFKDVLGMDYDSNCSFEKVPETNKDDVMARVQEHYNEALEYFPEDRIVGVFLQGSQNYGLEIPGSDVDTKLIVVPSFDNIVFNKKPVSTTHVRANDEHIDFKDLRLMFQTFRKQNLNFVEILFTEYKILNPLYAQEWNRLVLGNEAIAHYNPYGAVKTMKGMALEKYHAMEHDYPSKAEVLAQYGYDPKQVSHLVRVQNFISSYLADHPYEECLYPKDKDFIMDIKLGRYSLDEARKIADKYLKLIVTEADIFCERVTPSADPEVEELLDSVQYNIMEAATRRELK